MKFIYCHTFLKQLNHTQNREWLYNINNKVIKDKCIIGIIENIQTNCLTSKVDLTKFVQYIAPNIVITYNLTNPNLNQDMT